MATMGLTLHTCPCGDQSWFLFGLNDSKIEQHHEHHHHTHSHDLNHDHSEDEECSTELFVLDVDKDTVSNPMPSFVCIPVIDLKLGESILVENDVCAHSFDASYIPILYEDVYLLNRNFRI